APEVRRRRSMLRESVRPASSSAPQAGSLSRPVILYPHPVRCRGPRSGAGPLLRPVALLVFLSRSAGAGIVAPHPPPAPLGRLGCLLGGGGVGQVALPAGAHLLLLGDHRRVHAPEIHGDLVFDPLLHETEHHEGLLLVLGQRVALPVAPQSDSLLEVI